MEIFLLKRILKSKSNEKIVSQVISIDYKFIKNEWVRGIYRGKCDAVFYYEAQSKEHADRLIYSINNNIKHKINFLNKQKLKV